MGLVAVLALWLAIPAAQAQFAGTYDLRGAEFSVPDGWEVTRSQRDQEYDFVSPDGRFQLWARWWFPDEPLLGFGDIERHETRILAGQEALVIHTETAQERQLTVAFPRLDAEGEQFLWQLIAAPSVPLAEHRAQLEALLAGLSLDGVPALGAAPSPAGVMPGPPPRDAPGRACPTAPLQPPCGVLSVPGPPLPNGSVTAARFAEPQGAFSLPLPEGWAAYPAQAAGLRQAVLVPPGRDALVLAVLAVPDAGRSAAQVMDDFIALFMSDTVIVKDITDEARPGIAGTEAHAVEYLAKLHSVNGIALPYTHGRVWIYFPHEDAPDPFLLVTMRSEAASPDLAAELARVAEGFVPGTSVP